MSFLYERLSCQLSANGSDAAGERKACQYRRQLHRNSPLCGRADEGQGHSRTTERVSKTVEDHYREYGGKLLRRTLSPDA